MNTINVDNEVYAQIKKLADPAEDTPNSVLRRLFKLAANNEHPDADAWKRMTTPLPTMHRLPLGTKPTRRAAPHEVIAELDYALPIIDAVGERGGAAEMDDVLETVRWKIEPFIQARDLEPMMSGEPRWRTRALRCKHTLVVQGVLVKDAPIGIWRLTELGRKLYKREDNRLSPLYLSGHSPYERVIGQAKDALARP